MKKILYIQPEADVLQFTPDINFVQTGGNTTTENPSGEIDPGDYGGDD